MIDMHFYFGKDHLVVQNGEVDSSFRPYFYVIGRDKPRRLDSSIIAIELTDLTPYIYDEYRYVEGKGLRVWKVVCRDPSVVPNLRELFIEKGFKVSQSYIKYAIRYSIDSVNEIPFLKRFNYVEPKPKFLVFDVEKIGDRVLIGYSVDGKEINFTEDFRDIVLEDFDYLVGFNSWIYDYQVLKEKFSKYLPTEFTVYTCDGVKPHLDLAVFTHRWASTIGIQHKVYTLYEVAIELSAIPEGFDELSLMKVKSLRSKLSQLSESEVKYYLSTDVKVTYELAKKIVKLIDILSYITGISTPAIFQAAETTSPGHICEVIIHKYLEDRYGIVLEDRKRVFDYKAGDKSRAKAPGIYRNVAEYDFHMMYPTTYYQFMLDPIGVKEDQNGFPVKTSGGTKRIRFEGGPVYEVLKKFYEFRGFTKQIKKEFPELDQAAKIMVNAAYGIFGKKEGLGIVNEWCAAFIAQYTQMVFDQAWKTFDPIYGDTDSIFLELMGRDPKKLEDDINALIKKFGEHYEIKLEDIWDIVFIPEEEGKPLTKTYIKVKGDKVVLKGSAMQPRKLPRFLRYSNYHEWFKKAIEMPKSKFVEELVRVIDEESIENLFIEQSKTYADLFFTHEGKLTKRLTTRDRKVIFAKLYLEGKKVVEVKYDQVTILDALYIPTDDGYLIYHNGKIYLIDVNPRFRSDKEVVIETKTFRRIEDMNEVKKYVLKYIVEKSPLSYILKTKKMKTLVELLST